MKQNLDKLIGDAIWICKEYEKVSPPLFQRSLGLDLETAEEIFSELVKIGLVKNLIKDVYEDEVNFIGEVDKEKLNEILKN